MLVNSFRIRNRWQYLLRGLETSFSISPYDLNFADGADVSIVRALMVERTDTIANPRSVILNGKNSYADYEATAKVDFPAVEIQDEMRSQEEIRGSLVIFCWCNIRLGLLQRYYTKGGHLSQEPRPQSGRWNWGCWDCRKRREALFRPQRIWSGPLRRKARFTSCALLKEESGRKFSEHGSENAFRYQDISFQTCPGHCLGLKINIMNGE